MKTYKIKQFDTYKDIDWSAAAVAKIDFLGWIDGEVYAPRTEAQLVFVPGDGFYCHMTCYEKEPLAEKKHFDDHVYEDSCLEFFASYNNKKPEYVNIEMNARGAVLSSVGLRRGQRGTVMRFLDRPYFEYAVERDGRWSTLVRITLDELKTLLDIDADQLKSGYTFRGNFYKCGDNTAIPHYLMWNPCQSEYPEYHAPEYFGEFIIE